MVGFFFMVLLSVQPRSAARAVEAAYTSRGASVQVDNSLLRAGIALGGFSNNRVLEVKWDAVHRESLIKMSNGRSVVLLSTPQELPPLPSSSSMRPSPLERIRAGSPCTIVSGSGTMSLRLDGTVLRTAPIGGETRVLVPALQNRILRVRVTSPHTVEVLR